MKNIQYKKIFILGSGFSKSISSEMPTLMDLSDDLLQETNENRYYELIEFIAGLKKICGNSPELMNIEKIATIILSKALPINREEKIYYDILGHQLLNWIFNKIEENAPTVDKEKRPILRKFLENCSLGIDDYDVQRPALLMTFNYDLLLERLLHSTYHNWDFNYIVNLNKYLSSQHHTKAQKSGGRYLEYLKLHGSFNWFAAPGSPGTDLSNVYLVRAEDPARYLIHSKDIPVFIPMSYAKIQFTRGSLYNVLWNIAQKHIEEAEEIYFIGYGFPQADMDALVFFLRFKHKIRDIVVIEDETTEKYNRLLTLFPKSNILNMDAFEYIHKNHI